MTNIRYRKRPVIIDAFQLTEVRFKSLISWPNWLKENLDLNILEFGNDGSIFIITLEGRLKVSINDWVIKGINGELYPCKPDIFEATYEKVIYNKRFEQDCEDNK